MDKKRGSEKSSHTQHNTDVHRALHAAWHVACIRGEDVGTVFAPHFPHLVGKDSSPNLRDPSLCARHLLIHAPSHMSPTGAPKWKFPSASRRPREVLALLEDLHSSTGTHIRASWFLPWMRCRPGRLYPLSAGAQFCAGEEIFEVRLRPHALNWAHPRQRHARIALGLIPMGAFALWRLTFLSGWWLCLLLCIPVALVAVLLIDRGKWRSFDGAFLALVCGRLTGIEPQGSETSSNEGASSTQKRSGESFSVWPERVRPWNAYQQRIGSPLSHESHEVVHPGFIGEYALLSALWWTAQIAVHSGGVLVELPGGERRCVGAARRHVRIIEGKNDPVGAPSNADVTIGVGATYGDLPSWCTHIFHPSRAPVSEGWWAQISLPYLPREVPSTVSWEEIFPVSSRDEDHALPPFPAVSAPLLWTRPEDPRSALRRGCLSAPIGKDASGIVELDLVNDGPHALLIGTTGAGKSEALRTWLVGLCSRYSPRALRLVLIDYKGGATFRPLSALPHTEAFLTDLDPHATARALTGLQTHLVQRERQLSDLLFSDLAQWEQAWEKHKAPEPPPRILVVIDEFQVLSQLHPQALETINRVAAQGRSLGIHTIYATQRPSGSISGQMRANTDMRIALRTMSAQDSCDVIDCADAAVLPRIPGRAIIRGRGQVQFAFCRDPAAAIAHVCDVDPPAQPGTRLWAPPLPSELSWEELYADEESGSYCARNDPSGEGASPRAEVSIPSIVQGSLGLIHSNGHRGGLPVGLIDGLGVGAHYPLLWRGEHLVFLGPRSSTVKLQRHAYALAFFLALHSHVPLHVCSAQHGGNTYPGVVSRPADILTLWEEIAHAHTGVLFIDDEEQIRETLATSIGTLAADRAWNSFLRVLSSSDFTLVSVAPGRTGTGKDQGIYRMRLIDIPDESTRLAAGFPSSFPFSREEHLFFRMEDHSTCLLPHLLPLPSQGILPELGKDPDADGRQSPSPGVPQIPLFLPWVCGGGTSRKERPDITPRSSIKNTDRNGTGENIQNKSISQDNSVAPFSTSDIFPQDILLFGARLAEFSSSVSDWILIGQINSLYEDFLKRKYPRSSFQWLSPGQWLHSPDSSKKTLLFVNPSRETMRMITQHFPHIPFSLLAHEWDLRSGILIHHHTAFRFYLHSNT